MAQSARDLSADARDFEKSENVVVTSRVSDGARRYLKLPLSCQLVSYGNNAVASYDYMLNEYEHLRDFIGYSHNDYDLHKFRNWDGFTYEFDTSRCKRHSGYPELCESIVTIYESETNKPVWKFGIYLDESEL